MTGKKTSVDDIIGIVKTEEVTDSVEEVRKLRGRETMTGKRFEEVYGEMGLFRVKDNKTGKYYKAVLCGNPFTETDEPILDVLNEIAEENEQLKKRLELYGEIYPTGKWITELTSEELKKELEE